MPSRCCLLTFNSAILDASQVLKEWVVEGLNDWHHTIVWGLKMIRLGDACYCGKI